jgi:hypothetical protein
MIKLLNLLVKCNGGHIAAFKNPSGKSAMQRRRECFLFSPVDMGGGRFTQGGREKNFAYCSFESVISSLENSIMYSTYTYSIHSVAEQYHFYAAPCKIN